MYDVLVYTYKHLKQLLIHVLVRLKQKPSIFAELITVKSYIMSVLVLLTYVVWPLAEFRNELRCLNYSLSTLNVNLLARIFKRLTTNMVNIPTSYTNVVQSYDGNLDKHYNFQKCT